MTNPELPPIGQFEAIDRVLHEDISVDGTHPLSRLDKSPDHLALAAIDPVFDSLLQRVAERADIAADHPSYSNKHNHQEAEKIAREYAGPEGHRN